MRDPKRIKPYCDTLATIWGMVPDWRLSQLMVNAINEYVDTHGRDPFYMEDQEFIMFIHDYIQKVVE